MSRSSTRAALVAADAVLSSENTPYWNTDTAALSSAGLPADASSTAHRRPDRPLTDHHIEGAP